MNLIRRLASAARLLAFLLVACAVASISTAMAQVQREVITSFDSEIVVGEDGRLTVTETISAIAGGIRITRGIYRDFPTSYAGTLGLRESVGFELLGIWRDGRPEPHHIEHRSNGVRVYLGDPDRYVSHGAHVWRIEYRTGRQLRFLDEVDELYWNVTGNGWAFPIETVLARVTLPSGAAATQWRGYTGFQDDAGEDYRADTNELGVPVFRTTRTLRPREGLTIAVSWPKGFVDEPVAGDALAGFIAANLGPVIGLAGLVSVIVYFLIMWRRVGRDPEPGVVFPRFKVPYKWSPVATGFIAFNGFGLRFSSSAAFGVALTSLAIKGLIELEETGRGMVVRRITGKTPKLPPGEAAVLRSLFAGRREVVLDGTYDKQVENAVTTLRAVARREYTDDYIRSNIGIWLPGALLTGASGVAAIFFNAPVTDDGLIALFILFFAVVFGFAVWTLFRNVLPAIAVVVGGTSHRLVQVLPQLAPALIFAVPVFGLFSALNLVISPMVVVVIVLLLVVTGLFLWLLRAPTMKGRRMLDAIEGYKLYLTVAEEDRLDMTAKEPKMTVDEFETHLPYAMALGVADAWTRKFETRIDLTAPDTGQRDYRPRWYRSSSRFSSASGLTGHISSALSTSISSAATAPSSSSSGGDSFSGGGGSSGGGGGGGGGGGW